MSGTPTPRFQVLGRVGFTSAMLVVGLPSGVEAQYETSPAPAAYALEGVTVVQADGARQDGVTLVIRGGRIEAVGPEVPVPSDAHLLEGEDLHVYPGLVDPVGSAPTAFPAPEEEVLAWDPPREHQGFTPHRRASDFLRATGADLEDARRAGIVASAVFPDRGVMPGQGSLLLHRKDAETSRDLVVRPSVGVAVRLDGTPGSYPSTLFGAVAFLRQAFLDAEHHGAVLAEFSRDPAGLTAPSADDDLAVVRALAAGELRAFIRADGAEEVRRALALSEELGIDPVIVGGGEAWRVADLLRERDVPVVVSLDFPEPREWDPEQEEEELEPGALRERERLENLYANAGRLSDAGVRIAFTSDGGAADLREGARKAVEYGLPEAEAVRALTESPAELLGVGELGRIGTGSGATLVVVDGPLLEEETRVVYTFVGGALERVPTEDEAADETQSPSGPGGVR